MEISGLEWITFIKQTMHVIIASTAKQLSLKGEITIVIRAVSVMLYVLTCVLNL